MPSRSKISARILVALGLLLQLGFPTREALASALELDPGFSVGGDEDDDLDVFGPPPAPQLSGILELGSRGAMLDRCRMRMRDVTQIGEGASPDGRPATCRLLSFIRRQRFREAAGRRRRPLRLRFRPEPLLVQRRIILPAQLGITLAPPSPPVAHRIRLPAPPPSVAVASPPTVHLPSMHLPSSASSKASSSETPAPSKPGKGKGEGR